MTGDVGMDAVCRVTRNGVVVDGKRYVAPELFDWIGLSVTVSDSGGRTACFTPSGEYICDVSECTRPLTEVFQEDLRALQAARRRILAGQAAVRRG